MCEAPSGQSFHTGQIYAARYPITPLFASKLINFCTYFHHLCIIEKRHPLLSFLLATLVDIGLLSQRCASVSLQVSPQRRPTDRPTDRPIPATASRLSMDSAIFAKFFRTFWSIAPLRGVPDQKFCHQKFCLTTGNMFHTISHGCLHVFS